MFREQELIVEMHIEGTPIDHFLSFSLSQSFNAHHYFELRMEHGKLGLPGLVSLEQTREFVGRKLFISFGYGHANLQNFGGLITQVSLSQSNGFQGAIVISGYSPSILIDRGPDLGSYLDTSLGDIARAATKNAGDGLKLAIKPSRTAPLDYLIQYKESDFEFLNRLSASYYEWFYYDGEQLNFGKPDELKSGTLTYGREIKSLDYGIHIAPIKHKRFFYDAKEDELMDSESSGKAQGHPDLLHAVDRSNETYGKTFHQPANPRIDSVGDLNDFVKYEEQANVSQLLRVNAESDSPVVALGSEIQIDTSVRQELSFVTDTLGKFLITRVEHHFDGVGHYTNRFEGVSAGSERLPVTNFKTPSPDLQVADVVNNDDPKGQGRVKVKFKWPCQTNDETEWLRVLTPDAGSSDKVSANRGLVTIPEVGDQIIVGFEEGNVARPFVLGSVFHGKTGTGGGSGNNVKSLSSKSGNVLRLNDADGSVYLSDKGSANMKFDGAGNATTNANVNHRINAGNTNVINVGATKDQPAQSILSMDAEGNILLDGKTKITFQVAGNKIEISKEGVSITAEEGKIENTTLAGPILITSEGGELKLESKTGEASLIASTDARVNGDNISVSGGTMIRIDSGDTDIT